jgi:predicted NUDIX family phosphoesterase
MKLEQVVAVYAGHAKEELQGNFTEISANTPLDMVLSPISTITGSRAWLETDESFLQLIPYIMVTCESGNVLAYVRTNQTGEGRLAAKVSVGWGGHISVGDIITRMEGIVIDLQATVERSAERELIEELTFPELGEDADYDLGFEITRTLGLIYDDSNEVGRVHLGVLQVANIYPEYENVKHKITTEDEGIHILGFLSKEYLLTSDEIELETWSRIALEAL